MVATVKFRRDDFNLTQICCQSKTPAFW